jgi:branched-chain amino acid transport system ATP-binding protein
MSNKILELNDIHFMYDNIHALKGISLEVFEGEIVTLIGANGAGKTTTMTAISGLGPVSKGRILLNGSDITRWNTQKRVKNGIVLSPEGRQVFPDLSVHDNLMMGGYLYSAEQNNSRIEEVFNLFPRLKERTKQFAGTLSGGEQQMLAVGRALMSFPKLLLLDEPSMGLAPLIVKEIFGMIEKINSMGTTVLLVEQNARAALRVSHRAYIMETGRIVLSGSAKELLESDLIRKSYLGI